MAAKKTNPRKRSPSSPASGRPEFGAAYATSDGDWGPVSCKVSRDPTTGAYEVDIWNVEIVGGTGIDPKRSAAEVAMEIATNAVESSAESGDPIKWNATAAPLSRKRFEALELTELSHDDLVDLPRAVSEEYEFGEQEEAEDEEAEGEQEEGDADP